MPNASSTHPSDLTVLIVDDDALIVELLQTGLQRRGVRVLTALSGAGALEIASSGARFDLALIDVSMQGLNGDETAHEILRSRPDAQIYLTSGYRREQSFSRMVTNGLAGYVQKPFTVDELLETFERERRTAPSAVTPRDR